MARLIALLDANVLYPARLRDLFLRLAIDGQYQARWSARILDECFESLLNDRPDLAATRLARTRQMMVAALPDAMVEGHESRLEVYDLPDRDDRHVLAAAVTANADVLVTANLADFPARALPPTVRAESPDAFVMSLIRADVEGVARIVEQQAAALRNPPMTAHTLLNGLAQVALKETAAALRDEVD